MPTRFEIKTKDSIDLAGKGIISKTPIKVYNIKDEFTEKELRKIEKLLADPVVDEISVNKAALGQIPEHSMVIEQSPKPGVTDNVGATARESIEKILGREIGPVSFSKQYLWQGPALEEKEYKILTKDIGTPVTEDFIRVDYDNWDPKVGVGFHFPDVDLPEVEAFNYISLDRSDEELLQLSDDMMLALNLEEINSIKSLFKDEKYLAKRKEKGLDAVPTDAELQCLAQTWSEHCKHKKFNALWKYKSDDLKDESNLAAEVDSVFKSIIVASTEETAKEKDWLVSVFKDNAGVIRLNRRYNLSHKVETHNHPSGVAAFGGANTGTGGVIRDNASTGKYMRPISSQYDFRTPHPRSFPDLPLDIQAPRRTLEGVVAGVEDYGNKMGIPTIRGGVMIDDGWLKPAVYVGCVAVAPAEIDDIPTHVKNIRPGYIALTLGGGVGKDGIGGATGSSTDLAADAEQRQDVNQSVQIGNPIIEKCVFETMEALSKLNYIEASQDCGAGGWNSAVGELGGLLNELEQKRHAIKELFRKEHITSCVSEKKRLEFAKQIIGNEAACPVADLLRAEVKSAEIFINKTNGKGGVTMDLTNAPEKYKGLAGWEKLISESQEREVIVIKPENLEKVLEICKHNNVKANKIAEFNDTADYEVLDQGKTITYLPMEFLHQGLPQMVIEAHWKPSKNKEPEISVEKELTNTLLELMGRPNMQIYDWIMTRYDHEVQGGSVVKPIVGIGRGKSDAIAYHPPTYEGIAEEVVIESWGSNPWQGDIDAYHMGINNVVDAIGRTIAIGGNLDKIAFNGNTTCPKPEKDPEIAAKVIRMLKGAADAEIAFGTPTISGKDSTSMERSYISTETGKEVKVKAKTELLKSSLAVIEKNTTVTCDFKLPNDIIYVIGDTRDELGASEYYQMHNETGRNVPKSNLEELKERYTAVSKATEKRYIHSAQYVSKGGLGAALVNSAIAGDLGIDIELDKLDESLGRADKILFSETTGRFAVTVPEFYKKEFEEEMKGIYCKKIGRVRKDDKFNIFYHEEKSVKTNVQTLREKNKGEIRPEKWNLQQAS